MKLDFIDLGKLTVSPANMRGGRKGASITDILPSIRARGVLVPLLVRQNGSPETFEIVAGRRRFEAARLVADEREDDDEARRLPCAILADIDDAGAVEASLIENVARLDPDEVTRWETFSRLVKEGRGVEEISATFGLPELGVRRILALGTLMPRIRDLYRRDKIDGTTIRHLTMATKSQQRDWLALFDDQRAHCPTGQQLKAWLFGGASIAVKHALFDVEGMTGIVADLFGEDAYFADHDAFWEKQNAAIQARRDAYLADGWAEAVILPPDEHFRSWDYSDAPKAKGGRVYIDVRASGEVSFHEGLVTEKEARRLAKGVAVGDTAKPARPEITGTMATYLDLHRHAAVRAALLDHPGVALRLMVAHGITGSSLWTTRVEPQTTRNAAIAESVETCRGEVDFDEKRRAVLALLGCPPDQSTVARTCFDDKARVGVFLTLLDLPDEQVMDVLAVVMGETLAAGGAVVEAVGQRIGVDMAAYWQADEAFLEALRDREVLVEIVADVAGRKIATANRQEKGKALKAIVRDTLAGTGGRKQREGWVPRWMAFPPAAYTKRGGVGTVAAAQAVTSARGAPAAAEPTAVVAETSLKIAA